MTGPTDAAGAAEDLDREAAHLIALGMLPGIGPATTLRCHREGGSARAWEVLLAGDPSGHPALGDQLGRVPAALRARVTAAARTIDPAAELARHRAHDRRVLVLGGPGYPARLADDPAPPAVLFAAGRTDALALPTVAIVGTRNATRPGTELATRLGRELAEAGVAVVSGLALGIDGAAHRGALAALDRAEVADGAAAPPVGVIASGLDIAYPRRHVELHGRVAAHGLLLSETALGSRPVAWRFPARNRIIAGLADAIVVVESRSVGGSMLTAQEALDRGTPVLAVPGHPSAPAAAGTNDLLYDGATIVRGTDDVLLAIGITRPGPVAEASPADRLGSEHRLVLEVVGHLPAALPEIVARSGLSLERASEVLVHLEAAGRIVRSAGWFERATPGGSRSGEARR